MISRSVIRTFLAAAFVLPAATAAAAPPQADAPTESGQESAPEPAPESAPAPAPESAPAPAPELAPEPAPPTPTEPAPAARPAEPATLASGAPRHSVDVARGDHQVRLLVDVSGLAWTDERLRLLDDDRNPRALGRIGVGYRHATGLGASVSYVGGSMTPSNSRSISPSWLTQGVEAGLRFDVEVVRQIRPYAALAGGVRNESIRVDSPAGTLRDATWVPTAFGGLGIEVALPLDALEVFLFTEHGYHWQPEARFDDARIGDARPIDLGGAQLRGYAFRVGLGLGTSF